MPGGFGSASTSSYSSSSSYRYTPEVPPSPPPYSVKDDESLTKIARNVLDTKVSLIQSLLNAEAEILEASRKPTIAERFSAFFKDQTTMHDFFMDTIKALGTTNKSGVDFIRKNVENLFNQLNRKASPLMPVVIEIYEIAKKLHRLNIVAIESYIKEFNIAARTHLATSTPLPENTVAEIVMGYMEVAPPPKPARP